jgi:hypothetical protein
MLMKSVIPNSSCSGDVNQIPLPLCELMKATRLIRKCFAIALLLVFSQKIGGGLYLHNWLHAKNFQQPFQSTGAHVTGYSCNCVDEFSMPFIGAPEKLPQIIAPIQCEHFVSYKLAIPFSTHRYYLLRGPPYFS